MITREKIKSVITFIDESTDDELRECVYTAEDDVIMAAMNLVGWKKPNILIEKFDLKLDKSKFVDYDKLVLEERFDNHVEYNTFLEHAKIESEMMFLIINLNSNL